MATVLFPDIVFGPIHSRRLGISLGINLLPLKRKFCTFDCVYCECGLGEMFTENPLPTASDVEEALRAKLQALKAEGVTPDVFTFAGNGEPTLHPEFPQIIDVVTALRDEYFPQAKVSVLSNATQIHREEIRQALLKVDNNILKLDSAFDDTMRQMNRPWNPAYNVADLVKNLQAFQGKLIVQTMFLKGLYQGRSFDNTTPQEVEAWIQKIAEIKPSSVMIYSLDREAPVKTLEKIPVEKLREIAEQLKKATGIAASVAG